MISKSSLVELVDSILSNEGPLTAKTSVLCCSLAVSPTNKLRIHHVVRPCSIVHRATPRASVYIPVLIRVFKIQDARNNVLLVVEQYFIGKKATKLPYKYL